MATFFNFMVNTFGAENCPRDLETSGWCETLYDELLSGSSSSEGKAFLGNAFSLQMVSVDAIIGVTEIEPEDVPDDALSIVGHPDTANVLTALLGWEVPCNRASISLEPGDVLYVAQLTGGRLPEGATTLPEGFTLKWLKVVVH